MKSKILDCTLRDGGYYTNWDFDRQVVKSYLEAMNHLPIDYIEIGYRSPVLDDYYGEYFYCPKDTIDFISSITNKKLAIILNEKDVEIQGIFELLEPCSSSIHLVRMAVNPVNFQGAVEKARIIKLAGYEVAFNIMYLSDWWNHPEMLDNLSELDDCVDYLYLVDSYGSVMPEELTRLMGYVKSKTKVKIGFHGHNNIELALANTLVALSLGADIIDATVTGMGRGAGNLKTELLLTVLNRLNNFSLDFDQLSEVTSTFELLQSKYKWGTNLPYMIAGVNSLPQKQVMEWVSKNIFSSAGIIRALNNQAAGHSDNLKLNALKPFQLSSKTEAIVIGGGESVFKHFHALKLFIENRPNLILIHSSARNASYFKNFPNIQIFCISGNEGYRLEKTFNVGLPSTIMLLPPHPRKMGTYVPKNFHGNAYELNALSCSKHLWDTTTSVALEVGLMNKIKTIFFVGYDGYYGEDLNQSSLALFNLNEEVFREYVENHNQRLVTLTPSLYRNLEKSSIYHY